MPTKQRQSKPDRAERCRRPPVQIPAVLPELCDRALCAALLSAGLRSFDRLVATRTFPPPDVRLSPKFVRWRKATVLAAIDHLATATAK